MVYAHMMLRFIVLLLTSQTTFSLYYIGTGCTGKVMTGGDCSADLRLHGKFIYIGMNHYGNLGSNASSFDSPDPSFRKVMGLLVDKLNNGALSQYSDSYYGPVFYQPYYDNPSWVGDFVTLAIPLEAFKLQWTSPGGVVNKKFNCGMMRQRDMAPTRFLSSSNSLFQSSLWMGQTGELQLSAVTTLWNSDLFFTTSISIKNVGTKPVSKLYYMRLVDPDNEVYVDGYFKTANYVKYQPPITDPSIASQMRRSYTNPTVPNAALVCATGPKRFDDFLGLGAVNPHCRATHFGMSSVDPESALANTYWTGFGGADMQSSLVYKPRMDVADNSVHLTFSYDTLQPGEVITFDFVYVMQNTLPDVVLASLHNIFITQPSDIISGPAAVISVGVNASIKVTSCEFHLYTASSRGSSGPVWFQVGKTTSKVPMTTRDPNTIANYFETSFNSTLLRDGLAHLMVIVNTAQGVAAAAQRVITVANTGATLCFVEATPSTGTAGAQFMFPRSWVRTLHMATCTSSLPSLYGVLSVAYFREVYVNGELISSAIGSSISVAPYEVRVNVSDLRIGTPVYVKAVIMSTSQTGATQATYMTSTVFVGTVQNIPVPTTSPSLRATPTPTPAPSRIPTSPSKPPTVSPSSPNPSVNPSPRPTYDPTVTPTFPPTAEPTTFPSSFPSSLSPTLSPSVRPTSPTPSPTRYPTWLYSSPPTTTTLSSIEPSTMPRSMTPSGPPTTAPSATLSPSVIPTLSPIIAPSQPPTLTPSCTPSLRPSTNPTYQFHPTQIVSTLPTNNPTKRPTDTPSAPPSLSPTISPSSSVPINRPTALPSLPFSPAPTRADLALLPHRGNNSVSVTLSCLPAEACTGDPQNPCVVGYQGKRCSYCSLGYYRATAMCQVCPGRINMYMRILAVSLVLLSILCIAVVAAFGTLGRIYQRHDLPDKGADKSFALEPLRSRRVSILCTLVFFVVDYLQVLSLLSSIKISWSLSTLVPALSLGEVFRGLSVFTLSQGFLPLSCLHAWNDDETVSEAKMFTFTWALSNSLIVTIVAVLVYGKLRRGSTFGAWRHFAFWILALTIPTIVSNNLAVLDCVSPSPPDGALYLFSLGTATGSLCYASSSSASAVFAAPGENVQRDLIIPSVLILSVCTAALIAPVLAFLFRILVRLVYGQHPKDEMQKPVLISDPRDVGGDEEWGGSRALCNTHHMSQSSLSRQVLIANRVPIPGSAAYQYDSDPVYAAALLSMFKRSLLCVVIVSARSSNRSAAEAEASNALLGCIVVVLVCLPVTALILHCVSMASSSALYVPAPVQPMQQQGRRRWAVHRVLRGGVTDVLFLRKRSLYGFQRGLIMFSAAITTEALILLGAANLKTNFNSLGEGVVLFTFFLSLVYIIAYTVLETYHPPPSPLMITHDVHLPELVLTPPAETPTPSLLGPSPINFEKNNEQISTGNKSNLNPMLPPELRTRLVHISDEHSRRSRGSAAPGDEMVANVVGEKQKLDREERLVSQPTTDDTSTASPMHETTSSDSSDSDSEEESESFLSSSGSSDTSSSSRDSWDKTSPGNCETDRGTTASTTAAVVAASATITVAETPAVEKPKFVRRVSPLTICDSSQRMSSSNNLDMAVDFGKDSANHRKVSFVENPLFTPATTGVTVVRRMSEGSSRERLKKSSTMYRDDKQGNPLRAGGKSRSQVADMAELRRVHTEGDAVLYDKNRPPIFVWDPIEWLGLASPDSQLPNEVRCAKESSKQAGEGDGQGEDGDINVDNDIDLTEAPRSSLWGRISELMEAPPFPPPFPPSPSSPTPAVGGIGQRSTEEVNETKTNRGQERDKEQDRERITSRSDSVEESCEVRGESESHGNATQLPVITAHGASPLPTSTFSSSMPSGPQLSPLPPPPRLNQAIVAAAQARGKKDPRSRPLPSIPS